MRNLWKLCAKLTYFVLRECSKFKSEKAIDISSNSNEYLTAVQFYLKDEIAADFSIPNGTCKDNAKQLVRLWIEQRDFISLRLISNGGSISTNPIRFNGIFLLLFSIKTIDVLISLKYAARIIEFRKCLIITAPFSKQIVWFSFAFNSMNWIEFFTEMTRIVSCNKFDAFVFHQIVYFKFALSLLIPMTVHPHNGTWIFELRFIFFFIFLFNCWVSCYITFITAWHLSSPSSPPPHSATSRIFGWQNKQTNQKPFRYELRTDLVA